jgi:hypothetical protein
MSNQLEFLRFLNSVIYKSKICYNNEKEVNDNYFKYMMRNAVDLQISDINNLYPWKNCIISGKASGYRCLLVIHKNRVIL